MGVVKNAVIKMGGASIACEATDIYREACLEESVCLCLSAGEREVLMDQGLKELLEYPENSQCADCSEPSPTWASTNWGVFICVQCAGVHR